MKKSVRSSFPCYLITYAQPEQLVMGYTIDVNVLRWIIRHAPHNANLRVIEYNSVDDLEQDAEFFDTCDYRIFSHELTSSYDVEGNIYPPMFEDDDVTQDIAWDNFVYDVNDTTHKMIELLKFVTDLDVANLLDRTIRMIKYWADEMSKPHNISYWSDDDFNDPFDASMVVARYLSSEEGGLNYYYGDY